MGKGLHFIAAVISFLGVMCLLLGTRSIYLISEQRSDWTKEEGIITDMDSKVIPFDRDARGRDAILVVYTPEVTFIAAGKTYRFKGTTSNSNQFYSVGDKVTVYHDEYDPGIAHMGNEDGFLASFVVAGIGLVFTGIGCLFYFLKIKRAI
jgi:hypothetical protein